MITPRLLSERQRGELYLRLPRLPLSFSEKDLALYTQNTRLDPRLAEVVTEHLRDYWWKYDPRALNRRLKAQPWPAAIKPMLFQIMELCAASTEVAHRFGQWAAKTMAGIESAPAGLYFVTPLRPRSEAFDREVTEALPSFKKAGFFARDRLFNKGIPGRIKSYQDRDLRISTEDRLKFELFQKIRSHSHPPINIDRTTASKIKLGRLDQLSVKTLSRVLDHLNTP